MLPESITLNYSLDPEGGVLRYLDFLSKQQQLCLAMSEDTTRSAAERGEWEEEGGRAFVLRTGVARDPMGYLAWFVAEQNPLLLHQLAQFPA